MPTGVDLQAALRMGLTVVTEVWSYKAKDWITSVHAADIDNDGDVEVLASSRDGRVRALTKQGDCRWERIIGKKSWVGTIMGAAPRADSPTSAAVVVGTRDGKVYALDKEGKTIDQEGKLYPFDKEGTALDHAKEQAAFWYSSQQVIRQVHITADSPACLVIGAEDRTARALDVATGTFLWEFATNGWVRAIASVCDESEDGTAKIFLGSSDSFLYVLDRQGVCLGSRNVTYPIRAIWVADVDQDGENEILLTTDGKDLLALTPTLTLKWRQTFESRLHAIHVADVDQDGQNEIIVGAEDKHIYFLDAQGKVIWRHFLGYRVFSVFALDLDNDGLIEVLAGSEDTKVHAFHVNLIKDLERKIRRRHANLMKSSPATLTTLPAAEYALLQDILNEDVKEHEQLRRVTLQKAERFLEAQNYLNALADLLKLEQQKVQVLWHKEQLGHIRTLCLGDVVGDSKREIIVGVTEGTISVISASGRLLWVYPLGEPLLVVQTGYIHHERWEEIIACSMDHHISIISEVQKRIRDRASIDEWMSTIYIPAHSREQAGEIIVGSEDKKITFYGQHLQQPLSTFSTPQGIKTLCAHPSPVGKKRSIEIVAGSLENSVYAYTREGSLLWEYQARDRVQAVHMRDIDGDGIAEVIVGSEDRNVHVLTSTGERKWRYYLPHTALSIDTGDIDGDGDVEIMVGCADGYMYVLSREGELLWKYRSSDRIWVLAAEDIDDDGNVEIALGAEDELELLQVVNQQRVRLLIQRCWSALQQGQAPTALLTDLLHNSEPLLRAFALSQLADLPALEPALEEILENFVKDGSLLVRKALIRTAMCHFPNNPHLMDHLLNLLSMDAHSDVRIAFIEQIETLIQYSGEERAALGFEYLQRFSRNIDRFVRRAVVRKLHWLIDEMHDIPQDTFFELLLMVAKDEESEWLIEEAARTLAHFFDEYNHELLSRLFRLIKSHVESTTLQGIADHALTPVVQHCLHALVYLFAELDEQHVYERTEQAVRALEETTAFRYGKETLLIWTELLYLLGLRTLDEIAQYQCRLTLRQFTEPNEYHLTLLHIFEHLSSVTRILKIYLRRSGINDRLASLLESISAIETMKEYVEREYVALAPEEPRVKFPDHCILEFLFQRWHALVHAQLNELRGRADLHVNLCTRDVRFEEQIVVLLSLTNEGRSSANNVKVSLLHSDDFSVLGRRTHEIETVLPHDEVQVEFVIEPSAYTLNLNVEIFFDDVETIMKSLPYRDRLELRTAATPLPFTPIPNPYSTGTPIHDSKMFYGREEDIAFLWENLTRREAKTVLVLYGQRRSGKTTILLHLVNSPVLQEHIPVFIDMQNESYQINATKFLRNTAYYIFQALKERGVVVRKPRAEDFASDPTLAFDEFLDEVEAELAAGQKIILLIDEFEVLEEQVQKGRLDPEIFAYLRSLMQHRPHLNFLLSGTHTIEQLTRRYWSVFFNIARHHRLTRLSKKGSAALITRPVAGFLEYDVYGVRKIQHLTGDQPYLIHLICRALVDHCNEQRKAYVTINDINTVLQEVMQTGQFLFDWLWDQITPQERLALAALASIGGDDGRFLSLVEIEEVYRHYHLPYKRETLWTTLKSLVSADIFERDHEHNEHENTRGGSTEAARYRISVGLIRLWLRQEKPLEFVMRQEIQ